jgi:hypothetical protein
MLSKALLKANSQTKTMKERIGEDLISQECRGLWEYERQNFVGSLMEQEHIFDQF